MDDMRIFLASKIDELETEAKTHIANYHATKGAQQMCRQMVQELDKPKAMPPG